MAVYCTKCGAGWAAGEKFCRKCGARLSSGDLAINPPGEPTSEMRRGVETTTLNAVSAERFENGIPFETEPTLPMYAAGQRAVGSNAPDPTARSRRIARALNVAVGVTIVALAIGLAVIYLGAGRPTTSVVTTSAEEPGSALEATAQGTAPAQPEAAPETAAETLPAPDSQQRKSREKETRSSAEKDGEVAGAANGTASPDGAASSAVPARPESKADQQNPLTNEDHIKRGIDLYDSGKYAQAVAEFQAAGRLQPANGDAYYLMAMAYERMGRAADALSAYEKCKSGKYAALASQHVKRLSKQLKK